MKIQLMATLSYLPIFRLLPWLISRLDRAPVPGQLPTHDFSLLVSATDPFQTLVKSCLQSSTEIVAIYFSGRMDLSGDNLT